MDLFNRKNYKGKNKSKRIKRKFKNKFIKFTNF